MLPSCIPWTTKRNRINRVPIRARDVGFPGLFQNLSRLWREDTIFDQEFSPGPRGERETVTARHPRRAGQCTSIRIAMHGSNGARGAEDSRA